MRAGTVKYSGHNRACIEFDLQADREVLTAETGQKGSDYGRILSFMAAACIPLTCTGAWKPTLANPPSSSRCTGVALALCTGPACSARSAALACA